jgi:ADP-ribosylglycohydrolase
MTDLSADVLADKIRGGLLGQMLGNLNGIEHEMRYINEPGNVTEYEPALPEGAWTDDDTDFEWVYIDAMQRHGSVFVPLSEIAHLWRTRINEGIWCSNQYARVLMDLGLEPPLTGAIALNPWAEFNISGQFLCETFGLIAPGMPQTAGRIGLHYTRVAIDGEPAQTTQMFTAMIAAAFLTDDVEEILDSGVAALDPRSALREIVGDVRTWQDAHPDDWRATRQLVKEKYSKHGGEMRDRNGYELNTASTIAALAYGAGDLTETLRHAFNFGWDADNTAATAGTVAGVMKGYRWMMAQGWDIRDRYRNETRDGMPEDETITSFADRLIEVAERVIIEHGGERVTDGLRTVYHIPVEGPATVYPLPDLSGQMAQLQAQMKDDIESAILDGRTPRAQAQAAYLAIALDLADSIRASRPEQWLRALGMLNEFPQMAQVLYHHSPVPAAEPLRERARRAGLAPPSAQDEEWIWRATATEGERYISRAEVQ